MTDDPAATEHPDRRPLVTASGLRRASANVLTWGLLILTPVSFFFFHWINSGTRLLFGFTIPVFAAVVVAVRHRGYAMWTAYVVGFLTFAELRRIPATLLLEPFYEYVIVVERAFALGSIPTLQLQEWLYSPGALTLFDRAMLSVHFSYFLLPHIVALGLYAINKALFERYVAAFLLTCYFGLVVAFVLPTAPPWLAAEMGRLDHVYRIMHDALTGSVPALYDGGYRIVGHNDAAAMPSLHTAAAVLVAFAAAGLGRIGAVAGVLYAAAMGLALVYLGEHYIVDVFAGIAVAAGAWAVAGRFGRMPQNDGHPR